MDSWLGVKELADLLAVSPETITNWELDRRVPARREARKRLEAWLGEILPKTRRRQPHAYPPNSATLGRRIRRRRMDEGLQVKDLAELLGTTAWSISHWESDRRSPSKSKLERIEDWLAE